MLLGNQLKVAEYSLLLLHLLRYCLALVTSIILSIIILPLMSAFWLGDISASNILCNLMTRTFEVNLVGSSAEIYRPETRRILLTISFAILIEEETGN